MIFKCVNGLAPSYLSQKNPHAHNFMVTGRATVMIWLQDFAEQIQLNAHFVLPCRRAFQLVKF